MVAKGGRPAAAPSLAVKPRTAPSVLAGPRSHPGREEPARVAGRIAAATTRVARAIRSEA
ncbi:hypothetical protein GCM10022199_05280 [Marihabitans asiaticum]